MSQPNYFQNAYPHSPHDSPESGEDKAALTRRKNAEAQKLYRERKKAQELGLVSEVQSLKQKISILEAQLAYERAQQHHSPFPAWSDAGHHQLPPCPQTHGYIRPVNYTGTFSPDEDIFTSLDGFATKQANALFLQGVAAPHAHGRPFSFNA